MHTIEMQIQTLQWYIRPKTAQDGFDQFPSLRSECTNLPSFHLCPKDEEARDPSAVFTIIGMGFKMPGTLDGQRTC